ncbi:MAG: hypothetical protein ACOYET_04840 [Bacillota bacterium]|jgi:hypothetical protein
MKLRSHSAPPLPMRLRRRPDGIDDADWVDIVNSVSVDDELAYIFDFPRARFCERSIDIRDFLDRRGLDYDLE